MYKEELLKKFTEQLYTEEYFYYYGYPHCYSLPNIEPGDGYYQFAIVDGVGTPVGWLTYHISPEFESVDRFGLYSFHIGDLRVAKIIYQDLKEVLEKLTKTWHRVEWRCIGGNPISKTYDRICTKFGGHKVVLHDVLKDNNGKFRDEYIYEIVKEEST